MKIYKIELNYKLFNNLNYQLAEDVMKLALQRDRTRIIEFLSDQNFSTDEIETDYEGGIDSGWFGPGSVMLCELGLIIGIEFRYNEVVLTISTPE